MSIQIKNLSFSYGDLEIFKNLNITFPDKGLVVILGRSGSGKSTFLSLLNGFLIPTEGEIISSIDKENHSIVFQSPLLLDYLTVEENIALPKILKGEDIKNSITDSNEVIDTLNISDIKNKFPYQLSGGEMVRVSIARALRNDSSLLILDEPTGQLDEKNSEIIYQLLKELSKDRLIILVTHDEINGIRLADYLYQLENKSLVPIKTIEASINKKEYIEKEKKNFTLKNSIFLNMKFLYKKKIRFILSVIFLTLNMTLLYLGLNLHNNLDKSINSLLNDYFSSEVYSMTLEEEIASSGNLHLKRNKPLNNEALTLLGIKETYCSLEYFLPSYFEIEINKKNASVMFYPYVHKDKAKLSQGRLPKKDNEIVVNESFLNEFDIKKEKSLNTSFQYIRDILIYTKKFKSTDTINLNKTFTIVGISKERKAFNKAIVYYSHNLILNSLNQFKLENISEELNKTITPYNLLVSSKYDEEDIKGTNCYCIPTNEQILLERKEKYYKDNLKISSPSNETKESTKQIINSLIEILSIFLLLNTLSSIMLMFLSIYSLYIDNIRLFALIKVYNRNKKSIRKNAYAMQAIFLLAIITSTLIFSLISTFIINFICNQMQYPSFLKGFDLMPFLLIILASIACSFISSLFPLRKIKDSEISKELEGEE